MKISNYYTKQLALIMAAHRTTHEPISIKLTCGEVSTKELTLSIDCIWALRLVLTELVFRYKKANYILKDGRFSCDLECVGHKSPVYVGRYLGDKVTQVYEYYADAVSALNKFNDARIKRL